MARKVFISFLGTNNYVECRYKLNETISEPVRFVQEALITQICKGWAENDRIFIFCTSKQSTGENGAKELNWFDNGQSRIYEDCERIGLLHRLTDLKHSLGLTAVVEEVDIEAGFSENEIWNIFNTVYHKLNPGDEIYFDVTHAFRSIPLFSVVLFNYSKLLIGTRLKSIVYGAFEKLGSAQEVRKIPRDERIAPVIDLTNIARLQEYNQVASGLKDFGKVRQITSVIMDDVVFRELTASVTELDEYIATIDLNKIKSGKYITKFRNSYKFIKRKGKLVEPICNILDVLLNETSDFVSGDDFRNIEAAINWTIKHDMLMQTFPLAQEYIILRLADIFRDMKPDSFQSKDYREFISNILGMPDEDFKARNWGHSLANYTDVADLISKEPLVNDLRPLYDKIRRARNSLAHGNGSTSYKELIGLIPVINVCIERINSYSSTPHIKDGNVLINFSNHPMNEWSSEQFNTAKECYGKIIDLPFPSINPEAGETDLMQLAEEYVKQILELEEHNNITVHIMGEMTFTYMVVSQLKAMGIECIASTTIRDAKYSSDGKKISDFQFVRFRKY